MILQIIQIDIYLYNFYEIQILKGVKMKKIINTATEIADAAILAAITAIGFAMFFLVSISLACLLS